MAADLKAAEQRNVDTLDRATRDALLHRMVEGLHALIYGTYSVGSGDYALKALGDGGSIHEYVHGMLWLLPPRIEEQVQSGGLLPPEAAPGVRATSTSDREPS